MPDARLGRQRIEVTADWSLRELLTVCNTYEQLYSVLYTLQPEYVRSLNEEGRYRLEHLYQAFPWQGGYSAVNFYNSQRFLIPRDSRPAIRRIRIESPGFIDLGIAVSAAFSLHKLVRYLSTSVGDVATLYHTIYKQMQDRKLMRINAKREELALARDQLRFAEDAQRDLAEAMQLEEAGLIRRLAANPLGALKIIMSIYRRARTLSKAEGRQQLELLPPEED